MSSPSTQLDASSQSQDDPDESERAVGQEGQDESPPDSQFKPIRAASQRQRPAMPTAAYRALLNEVARETTAGEVSSHGDDRPLPSQVGTAYWSGDEKERFFRALAVAGRDDVMRLCDAVGTKSRVQIHEYLLVLDDAARAMDMDGESDEMEAFASTEVGRTCEDALNSAADRLAAEIEKREAQAECDRFGQYGVIDEDVATEIDEKLDLHIDAVGGDDIDLLIQEGPPPDIHPQLGLSLTLLRPSALISLSSGIYMNGPPAKGLHYSTFVNPHSHFLRPALHHSALDLLYEIARSLTTRLTAAAIFQTGCRLRATNGNDEILPMVRERDVRTAVDVLATQEIPAWSDYWVSVARRFGVEVYSNRGQFHDGRPRTQMNLLLTYDEVEQQLGSSKKAAKSPKSGSSPAKIKEELSTEESDTFGLTDQAVTPSSDVSDPAFSNESGTDTSLDGIVDYHLPKRPRSPSPDTVLDNETQHLESLDQGSSRQEERRLMRVLRPRSVAVESDGEDDIIPLLPHRRKRTRRGSFLSLADDADDWRAQTTYRAAWEQQVGGMPKDG